MKHYLTAVAAAKHAPRLPVTGKVYLYVYIAVIFPLEITFEIHAVNIIGLDHRPG